MALTTRVGARPVHVALVGALNRAGPRGLSHSTKYPCSRESLPWGKQDKSPKLRASRRAALPVLYPLRDEFSLRAQSMNFAARRGLFWAAPRRKWSSALP